MTISPYTVKARAIFRAFYRQVTEWTEKDYASIDLPQDIVDHELYGFFMISARVSGLTGVDFELCDIQDEAPEILRKYITYLNTTCMDVVRDIDNAITAMDKPADADLAPGAILEGED